MRSPRARAASAYCRLPIALVGERRLLLRAEEDEPDRAGHRLPGEAPRQLEHTRDAAAVVVRARRALGRVVVPSHNDDLVRLPRASQRCLQVPPALTLRVVLLGGDGVAHRVELGLDIRRCSDRGGRLRHAAFADFTGQLQHVAPEAVAERLLVRGERRERTGKRTARHPDHEEPDDEKQRREDARQDQHPHPTHNVLLASCLMNTLRET